MSARDAVDADGLNLSPPGCVVVLDRTAHFWSVFFDPPLADGERRSTFADKNSAWGEAMRRAADNRCGFRDDADAKTGVRSASN